MGNNRLYFCKTIGIFSRKFIKCTIYSNFEILIDGKLVDLARVCATKVIVTETNCWGFAGDRGFTYPELNKHGLRNLRAQLPETVKHGYSNSRTCEIGLSLHTGISHKSIVYLVDQVSIVVTKS